jgi:hypothetical protein
VVIFLVYATWYSSSCLWLCISMVIIYFLMNIPSSWWFIFSLLLLGVIFSLLLLAIIFSLLLLAILFSWMFLGVVFSLLLLKVVFPLLL